MEPAGVVILAVVAAVLTGALAALVVHRLVVHDRGQDHPPRGEPSGAELQQAVDTLVAVAGEQLDARARAGAEHLESRKELIDAELGRLGATLTQLTTLIQRVESERSTQLGQVRSQLEGVARTHAELGRTTETLSRALTNSQVRGQWGERMAADVLRAAGFVEGVNYRTQTTTRSGTRPDVTFLLPGDRVVHMDVKFPLAGYLEVLEAPDDAARERARTAFCRAARARVRELATRGYIDEQDHTLDVVLLFIPNEQVHAFLLEHDPTLLDDALAQRVVLCSPATLFAVLAVLRQAVDAFALERATDDILQLLAGFCDQWERFTSQLDKVGRALDATQRAYATLSSTRRSQLERQLERVEELRRDRSVADDGTEPTPSAG